MENNHINKALNIGNTIYREYQNILTNPSNTQAIQNILALKAEEKSTLEQISFDKDTIENLKNKFSTITREKEPSLPYGLECDIKASEYPYHRLMAYIGHNSDVLRLKSIDNILIALLYHSLYSLQEDPYIQKRALMILMNSLTTEHQVLENNLKPLEEIYDTLELEIGLKNLSGAIQQQHGIEIYPYRILDSVDERISYFINELMHLSDYLNRSQLLYKDDYTQRSIIQAYLNSLIAILDQEDIDSMRYNAMEILPNVDIQDFVMEGFDEAPKLMKLKKNISTIKF